MKYKTLALTAIFLMGHTAISYAFLFTPGDYYASNYSGFKISQYDQSGVQKGTLNLNLNITNASAIKGIAYGGNGLMYGVVEQSANYSVVAFDETGLVHQRYQQTGFASGNLSYGKITFDNQGHFYVGEGAGVSRFTIGDAYSAKRLYSGGVYDG